MLQSVHRWRCEIMAYDGIVTRAVVHDLQHVLTTGRIVKIHQPYKTDLVLTVRVNGKNKSLFLSANPSFARIHLTEGKFLNPKEPPMFCMILRKYLEGSIIENIQQKDLERMVTFTLKGRDELGDISYKHLVVELMGRHSNIILLDEEKQKVIDSIKHVPPSISSYRTVLPGQAYKEPPHLHRLNPLKVNEEEIKLALNINEGKMKEQILQSFSGLSPQIVDEILHIARFANRETIPPAFINVLTPVKNHHYKPQMIVSDNGTESFSVIELTHKKGKRSYFQTVHQLLDRYFLGKAERDRVKQQANDLEKFLRNENNKNKKKMKKLEKALMDADKANALRHFGELLTANMHEIKQGQKEITVVDYYDPNQNEITIPLDPQKSPSENAQHFFKRYQKLKNSVAVVQEQLQKTAEEIQYLDTIIQQIETAAPKDIEEIREELMEQGYLKNRAKKATKNKATKPVFEQYVSSEGIPIYVGKNNKQNDYLTNKLARQNDTWLHTKDIPGSHVIIRGEQFGEKTLMEAANLAAYFSKGRHSGQVPVDYTLIRHVKKPSGAKPGYVIYDNQTTIYVTPDEDLVLKLKSDD